MTSVCRVGFHASIPTRGDMRLSRSGDWPGTENRAQLPEQLRYPEGRVPDVVEIRSEPAGSTPKGLDTPLGLEGFAHRGGDPDRGHAVGIDHRAALRGTRQYPASLYAC